MQENMSPEPVIVQRTKDLLRRIVTFLTGDPIFIIIILASLLATII